MSIDHRHIAGGDAGATKADTFYVVHSSWSAPRGKMSKLEACCYKGARLIVGASFQRPSETSPLAMSLLVLSTCAGPG